MKFIPGIINLSLLGILVSCTAQTNLSTPLSEASLPAATALTLEASGVEIDTPSPTQPAPAPSSITPSPLPPTTTPAPSPTIGIGTPLISSVLPPLPSNTPIIRNPLPPLPSDTPLPNIPESPIQIYQIGELSKVTSPISVYALLTPRTGKIAKVELYGENGSLLARYVQRFDPISQKSYTVYMNLDFEIEAIAEKGRLVVSVEDEFGRLIDLNSVDVILLSKGASELNPPLSSLQAIVIQQPPPKALFQGGMLLVTGLVLPEADHQLKMELINEKGMKISQRLTSIKPTLPGNYGSFVANVPFKVNVLTPARLIVYQDGGNISPMIHLSSVEVLLSP